MLKTRTSYSKVLFFSALILSFSILFSFLFSLPKAFGFATTGESGELTNPGRYRLGLEPQIILSRGSGANVDFFIDMGLNEETSWRALIGTGNTDFYAGGSIKWMPIPDFQNQPAMGLKGEFILGRQASETFTLLRLHPLISKKFPVSQGLLTPYAALPIGIFTWKSTSANPINLVFGTEFQTPQMKGWTFNGEIGFDANQSFSYLSGSISIYMDELNFVNHHSPTENTSSHSKSKKR